MQEFKETFSKELKELKEIITEEITKKDRQIEELKMLLQAIYEHNYEQYRQIGNKNNEADRRQD